jgi:hypothetical protein
MNLVNNITAQPTTPPQTIMLIQPTYSPLLQINGTNSEPILIIEGDGVIKWKKDGVFKILEDEKEIAVMFMMVISSLSGFNYTSKEELIQTIIKNYRNGRIDNIFQK